MIQRTSEILMMQSAWMVMGNPFPFQGRRENKYKWQLSVGPGPGSIDLRDYPDGGDHDPEKNWKKYNRYRILRLEFQNLYYPVMDNFVEMWLKDPQANGLPEEDKALYLFLIESTRSMISRLEQIEKDFPVTEGSLDSGQNGKNLKSSVLANRMQICQFMLKTIPYFGNFLLEFDQMEQVGRIRAGEFLTIQNAIMDLVQDLCHLEVDNKNSEL